MIYTPSDVQIHCGDALDVLRTMPDGAVNCIVTSPPYFGLRDYGTATWEGGDEGCDHVEMTCGMSEKNTLGPTGYLPNTNAANVGRKRQFRDTCGKCGATRIDNQIGLESTPSCGMHGRLRLRRDLTEAQKEFVVRRLLAEGRCDV